MNEMYLIQIYTQTNKINQTTKKAIDQNKMRLHIRFVYSHDFFLSN
jgi:hypothetical protein